MRPAASSRWVARAVIGRVEPGHRWKLDGSRSPGEDARVRVHDRQVFFWVHLIFRAKSVGECHREFAALR